MAAELVLFKSYFLKLKKLGMEFATIYGREPTLWDREASSPNKFLKELIGWLSKELKVRVCLATSGISLDGSVLKVLFDNQGVLFMKDWGGRASTEKLIKYKQAYPKIRRSWSLVKQCGRRYKKIRVIAVERAGIQRFFAKTRQQCSAFAQAISTSDLQCFTIPHHQVTIVMIKAVEIAALAGAFTDAAESQLPQTADFTDHG